MKKEDIIKVFDFYRKYGEYGYIGEEVTQLQHATQAALLAEEKYKNQPEIILGAFLHDIGHLFEYQNPNLDIMEIDNVNYGIKNHEKIGADYLRKLNFSEITCSLVENHIKIKRYLLTKNPDYIKKLSNASKQSFKFQGGYMNQSEISKFEEDSNFNLYIDLRNWDDQAKDTNSKILEKINKLNPTEYYQNMALKFYNL